MGCPTAPPSPMQRHHRSTASPPRRQQPHGTGVYPAAVQLRKGEETYPGSTVKEVHYDPNIGIKVRLSVCNPNPNRVKTN